VAVMVAVTVTTLKLATHPLKKRAEDWAGICMCFFISNRNKYMVYNDNLKQIDRKYLILNIEYLILNIEY
jgi:hypothetical protein